MDVEFLYCPPCDLQQPVAERFEDEDERFRPVTVCRLECGHEQLDYTPNRWREATDG